MVFDGSSNRTSLRRDVGFLYVSLLSGALPGMSLVEQACRQQDTERGWRNSMWKSKNYSTRSLGNKQKENPPMTLKRNLTNWNVRSMTSSNGSGNYRLPKLVLPRT